VIVCNAKEAGFFVTRSLHDEKSIDEAGHNLLAHFGCSAVVITRGEKGMSLFEESSPHHLTIPATSFEVTYARVGQPGVERGATARQVFDVTGAGDTVLSVLSVALAAGASLPDAAFLANTAAGVVVGKLGTASVTLSELSAALDDLRRSSLVTRWQIQPAQARPSTATSYPRNFSVPSLGALPTTALNFPGRPTFCSFGVWFSTNIHSFSPARRRVTSTPCGA